MSCRLGASIRRVRYVVSFACVALVVSWMLAGRKPPATMVNTTQTARELPTTEKESSQSEGITPESWFDANQVCPRIYFEKTVHDFGELNVSERSRCQFRFRSTGRALLRIGEIESTCGCIVASLDKREFTLGEEGVIEVRYGGQNTLGSISKSIFVRTNDPENSKVKLTIEAKVIQQVEVIPQRFTLSLSKENAGIQDITLKSKDGKKFSIKGIPASNGTIKVDFDPNVVASEFVLKPTVDVERLEKYPRGMMKIDLTHPECSSVVLFYALASEVRAQPGRIMLYNANPNKPQTREILLRNADRKQFDINSVSSKRGSENLLFSGEQLSYR